MKERPNCNMEKVIQRIINDINSKKDWSLNEKIRYAYIELGKNIHLNYEFFYSLYGLMSKNYKLTYEQISAIYNNVKPTYNVMCKDCARMLKEIFDGCNIKSEIKETVEINTYQIDGKQFNIQHFFNVVEGDKGEKYFLSLVLDIPYIQLGMKTEHFGTNVVYYDDKGNQVYNGEEIKNVVLSKEKIRNIDEKIGYLDLKFDSEDSKLSYYNDALDMLIKANQKNKMYYQMMALNPENIFYKGLIDILSDSDSSLSFKLSDITVEKVKEIKKYVCLSSIKRMAKELIITQEEIDSFNNLLNQDNYTDALKLLEKILKNNNYKSDDRDFTLNALITASSKLFIELDSINDINLADIEKLKSRLSLYIFNIAKVFIKKEHRPLPNYQYTNKYLENKLKTVFPLVFDFGQDTAFSHMKLGEKSIIISRIMQAIFPELSNDKTVLRKKENPIDNRISTCMLYDTEDEMYKLLINIEPTKYENDIVLIYNFNDGYNYFEDHDLSILEMKADSDRYMFFSKKIGIPAESTIRQNQKL